MSQSMKLAAAYLVVGTTYMIVRVLRWAWRVASEQSELERTAQ